MEPGPTRAPVSFCTGLETNLLHRKFPCTFCAVEAPQGPTGITAPTDAGEIHDVYALLVAGLGFDGAAWLPRGIRCALYVEAGRYVEEGASRRRLPGTQSQR